jgi:hypothetical protein
MDPVTLAPHSGDYMDVGLWSIWNSSLQRWDPATQLPGSGDTADIPAGGSCSLSTSTEQVVAGLTVEGTFTLGSKLSVTTGTSTGTFTTLTGAELDNVGSFDFYGTGSLAGQIDAGGSNITFHPGSSMTLAAGVNLGGLGAYIIDGPVTCDAALNQTSPMYLNDDGGATTSGSLVGPGSMTLGGDFTWSGGVLGLTGGVSLQPNSGFKTTGSDGKTIGDSSTISSIA